LNWFDILKNAGLAQSQRQGISARQKDEDFIFEDDDDDCRTWFEGLLDMVTKFYKEMEQLPGRVGMDNYWRENAKSERRYMPEELRNPPDEMFCAYKKFLQSTDRSFVEGGQQHGIEFYPNYFTGLDVYWEDHFGLELGIHGFGYIQNHYWSSFYFDEFENFEEFIKTYKKVHSKILDFSKKLNSYLGPNTLFTYLVERAEDRLEPDSEERLRRHYNEWLEEKRERERGE